MSSLRRKDCRSAATSPGEGFAGGDRLADVCLDVVVYQLVSQPALIATSAGGEIFLF